MSHSLAKTCLALLFALLTLKNLIMAQQAPDYSVDPNVHVRPPRDEGGRTIVSVSMLYVFPVLLAKIIQSRRAKPWCDTDT
jgi:hypothetical protein